nr:ran guanine nucleotide release factor-like [Ipomoea trifida]
MAVDMYSERPLFGGAIASTFPVRFQDVSNVRQVPDHQEVFVDPARDESLIFELLELKQDVADNGSATWFLQDLANEQDAEGTMLIEQSGVVEAPGLSFRTLPAIITTAVGQMDKIKIPNSVYEAPKVPEWQRATLEGNPLKYLSNNVHSQAISKGRQGREAQNLVKVYLANVRLKEVTTDILITAYEPIVINSLSESASTVGAGVAVPAAQAGCMPMAEVFKLAVSTFKVNDWRLFGAA